MLILLVMARVFSVPRFGSHSSESGLNWFCGEVLVLVVLKKGLDMALEVGLHALLCLVLITETLKIQFNQIDVGSGEITYLSNYSGDPNTGIVWI